MKRELMPGYSSPIAPPDEERHADWQARNQAWWEAHPMRYDWNDALGVEEFSREFYEEIDRRFFDAVQHYLPARARPFDALVPFDRLAQWDVLEIGVGSGSHAQLLAPHCRSYTGIDLTAYAVRSTAKRFERFGVKGRVMRMDAEQMALADASFDYIWTWGVIHHSADTSRVLREMYRVLRPGGRATVMVYHRSWLYTYFQTALLRGIVLGGLRKHSLTELLQLHTDGAIARFYRTGEWRALVERAGFVVADEQIKGQKSEVVPLPRGRVKSAVTRLIPDRVSRLVTNRWRQGSFLITTLTRP